MTEPDTPLACALPDRQRSDQIAEWQALSAHASVIEATTTGVVATYPVTLAQRVEDLVQREIACCGSWLQITHERDGDDIRVRLSTSSAEGRQMIQSLSGCNHYR